MKFERQETMRLKTTFEEGASLLQEIHNLLFAGEGTNTAECTRYDTSIGSLSFNLFGAAFCIKVIARPVFGEFKWGWLRWIIYNGLEKMVSLDVRYDNGRLLPDFGKNSEQKIFYRKPDGIFPETVSVQALIETVVMDLYEKYLTKINSDQVEQE